MNRLIILNPASKHGSAARNFERLFPALLMRLGKDVDVIRTSNPGDATELVRTALLAKTCLDQILVAGGDGTINEAVNGYFDENGHLIRQDIPLGIINLGTGGDFHRTLIELSDDYDSAIEENRFSKIDCGEAIRGSKGRTQYFINISSVGLAGKMLENMRRSTFRAGAAAYFFHSVKALLSYRPNPVEIEYFDEKGDFQSLKVDLINLFICNGRCSGGGMKWAPSARLQSGLFELTLISGRRKLPLITNSSKLYTGRIAEFPGAQQIRASRITVRYQDYLSLETDGEIIPPAREESGESKIRFHLIEGVFPMVI